MVLHWLTDRYVERDSLKDKMVVYAFILLTVGLLVYAAFEPYLKPKIEVSMWDIYYRHHYTEFELGNTGKEELFSCTIEWREYIIYSLISASIICATRSHNLQPPAPC